MGGQDLAPRPTEFMMMSLGFCQMSVIVWVAGRMRIEIDDVRIKVTGDRDDRGWRDDEVVRCGYYLIEMETEIASSAPVDRLVKLAAYAEKDCAVYDNPRLPNCGSQSHAPRRGPNSRV